MEPKDAFDWSYRGEGAVNLVLAYTGSSPTFVSLFPFPISITFYLLIVFRLQEDDVKHCFCGMCEVGKDDENTENAKGRETRKWRDK